MGSSEHSLPIGPTTGPELGPGSPPEHSAETDTASSGSYIALANELSERLGAQDFEKQPEVAEVNHLQRAQAAWEVAWRLYADEVSFQAHLWNRFRDMVKIYLGALGVLGLALRQAFEGWDESCASSVLGVAILALGLFAACVCGLLLIGVFSGRTFKRVDANDARAAFRRQADFFDDLAGRKNTPPRPEEIFPQLTLGEYLGGGRVPEAGMAVALDRVAVTTLNSTATNAEQNARRTKDLNVARHWLIAHAVLALIGWGVVFLSP